MSTTKTEAPKGHIVKDAELAAMNNIAKAYAALERLDPAARGRVKQWASSKFHPVAVQTPRSADED